MGVVEVQNWVQRKGDSRLGVEGRLKMVHLGLNLEEWRWRKERRRRTIEREQTEGGRERVVKVAVVHLERERVWGSPSALSFLLLRVHFAFYVFS